jgi:hypothetical protein
VLPRLHSGSSPAQQRVLLLHHRQRRRVARYTANPAYRRIVANAFTRFRGSLADDDTTAIPIGPFTRRCPFAVNDTDPPASSILLASSRACLPCNRR